MNRPTPEHDGPFTGDGEGDGTNWTKGKNLGRNGYSAVYLVVRKDNTSEKKYAAKQYFISDDTVDNDVISVRREMITLKTLKHKSILRFYGHSQTSNAITIFIEFMPQGSLTKYLKDQPGGVLTESKALDFSMQITDAVIYLHSKKIMHRDIKGSNILLKNEFIVKLADFGLSKMVHTFSNTRTARIGTMYWMAPELFQDVPYSYKIDIWSVGCTLFQMISGQPPFKTLTQVQFDRAAREKQLQIEPPSSCSVELGNLIRSACTIDPDSRPDGIELKDRIALINYQMLNPFNESDCDSSDTEQGRLFSDAFELVPYNPSDDSEEETTPLKLTAEKDEILKNKKDPLYAPILAEIDTRIIVPHLLQSDTISAREMEDIEEAGDRRKRAEKLLYLILSKNAESNFITALKQSDYRRLAEHLATRGMHSKLTERDASRYASAVGRNWKAFCLNLNFTQVEIDQEYESCNFDVKQTITNLLIRWLGIMKDQATHMRLQEALKKTEELHRVRVDWDHVDKIFKESIEEWNNRNFFF